MKKITALIVFSFFIIAACMVYLVYSGISLRSAALIQPSVISADKQNIASSVMHRLYQEFQGVHYIVWGVLPTTVETQAILADLAEQYKKRFNHSVNLVLDAESFSAEKLRACPRPCWLLVNNANAHQLQDQSFFTESRILPLQKPFITFTVIDFNPDQIVAAECEDQKRLSLHVLFRSPFGKLSEK